MQNSFASGRNSDVAPSGETPAAPLRPLPYERTESTPDGIGVLVKRAASGDERAWVALVDRYSGMLWAIAREHGLGPSDAADVCQTTWLRLVERLTTLRKPDSVGAWLATTVRREARSRCRSVRREQALTADPMSTPYELGPEERAIESERQRLIWRAVATMPARCRRLLRVICLVPPLGYREIAAALDIPIGSIGPTRARCLERLRELVDSRYRETT